MQQLDLLEADQHLLQRLAGLKFNLKERIVTFSKSKTLLMLLDKLKTNLTHMRRLRYLMKIP